ncbi:MAG: response regulator transcription factor [Firmicutes bacterium]|nr:response regulator transcription factor [[Eubacterium] siraeum]MCM1487147.1 response regulator transcription factor [Bacillota bacterium]
MSILVVDDDPLVTMSIKTILEAGNKIKVLASGDSGEAAISLYKQHRPDLLLMDIRMNEMTGLEAAEEILDRFPDAKILFLTTFSDDEYILKALEIGAKGYILKQDFEGIEAAVTAVTEGQSVFGSQITARLTGMVQKTEKFNAEEAGLSRKELEIIEQVAKGLSNREISSALYLSEGTVRNYISGILLKLGLRDRTQLAVFYFEKIK